MKNLTDDLVQRYRDTGYLAPIRVLSTAEAAQIRAKLEAFEAGAGPLAGKLRQKSHLLFTWLNDLIRHERILDAVEDIIGPDILCWGTSFFIKEPHNPAYVSWHQDFNLLGSRAGGHRHGVGRTVGQHNRKWRDACGAGLAHYGTSTTSGHIPSGQPSQPRPGNHGRGR